MMPHKYLSLLFCFNFFVSSFSQLRGFGPNVCEKTEELPDYSSLWLECDGEKNESEKNQCFDNLEKTRFQKKIFCCSEFIESEGECIYPNTSLYKECNEIDECTCFPKHGGFECLEDCEFGKFGRFCEKNCECILDKNCNSEYTYCSCLGEINDTCKDICNCKMRLCDQGWMGKKCDLECPIGKYGRGCLSTCSCVEKNTLECRKENGECRCKDNFYGEQCEKKCDGILKCSEDKRICDCGLTIEGKIDQSAKQTKDHVEQKNKEMKDYLEDRLREVSKNLQAETHLSLESLIESHGIHHEKSHIQQPKINFEMQIDVMNKRILCLFIIFPVFVIFVYISLYLYHLKNGAKKIEYEKKKKSSKCSENNDQIGEFENAIYEMVSFEESPSNKNEIKLLNQINTHQKLNFMKDKIDSIEKSISEKLEIYERIDDRTKFKTNDEAIEMPENDSK